MATSSTELKTRQSHQTVGKLQIFPHQDLSHSNRLHFLAFPAATAASPEPASASVVPDPTPAASPSNDEDLEYEEDDEEEYDEEYEENNLNTKASVPEPIQDAKKPKPASIMHTTPKPTAATPPKAYNQISAHQKQAAATTADKFRLTQTQNGVVNHVKVPAAATTTEKVPEGFQGKVENVAKPTAEPRKYHTRFLPSKHLQEMQKEKQPDSYVTVTKSVTGSIDDTQSPPVETPHFGSTYYTKSSTCGYFTFSCNIVYGSNGRSKICRPKAPTNGKC